MKYTNKQIKALEDAEIFVTTDDGKHFPVFLEYNRETQEFDAWALYAQVPTRLANFKSVRTKVDSKKFVAAALRFLN